MELKGWGVWRDIRGIGITEADTKTLIGQVKTRIAVADLGNFSWDLTDKDQEIFELKMLRFLWFSDDVIPREQTCAVRRPADVDSKTSGNPRLQRAGHPVNFP